MTADPSTVWDQPIIADCRDAHRWDAGDPTLLPVVIEGEEEDA